MAAKRKSISLSTKLSIVEDLECKRKTQADICKEMGLSKSTVSTLWANRMKIKAAVTDGSTSSSRKKLRVSSYEDVDMALYQWFVSLREKHVPVSGALMKAKAEKFAESMGLEHFKCSNGWLEPKTVYFR